MTQNGLPVFSDGAMPGENDVVIALMGVTGSGKSSIISLCTDQEVNIGHELVSCTQDVETYVYNHPTLRSGRVYLVDTPGFDDTNRKDTEILRTLSAWLTATYSSGIKLSGIIYCHRINQTRMQGSAIKNIQLFRSLCGDDALSKVVLVTTMWDIEKHDIAEKREKELKETTKYWGNMIAKGSRVLRHYNTQQSAFALVDTFVKDDSKIVLGIQQEMVNDQKPLDKTEAGQDIKSMLDEQHASLRSEIHTVESDLREALRAKDEELAQVMSELRLEHKQALQQVLDNQQKLQATMQQLHKAKSAELEDKLEEERRKWKSQVQLQSPYGVSGSSVANTQQTAGAYESQKPPSLHLPSKVKVVYLFQETVTRMISTVRAISPDGSFFTSGTYIIETKSGTRVRNYEGHLNPIRFSSDGETLALQDFSVLYKARLNRSTGLWDLRPQRNQNRFSGVLSGDLETAASVHENEVELTSLATGTRQTLAQTSVADDLLTHVICFAKNDELLICRGDQSLCFFEINSSRLLARELIPDLAGLGAGETIVSWDSYLSGDGLSLCVVAYVDGPSASIEHRASISLFQLSGVRPELMATAIYPVTLNPSDPNRYMERRASLSFDGRYIAFCRRRDTKFDIIHTMSGRKVLNQKVEGEVWDIRFFPSDNRFMWLESSLDNWIERSYHVARLIEE